MAASFEILQRPEGCQFINNLKDIVVRRPAEIADTILKMSVTTYETTICQDVILHFDNNRLITIHLCNMVKGLINYNLPTEDSQNALHSLGVTLSNPGNETVSIIVPVICGGIDSSKEITDLWWSQNWLTWQPQIITTTTQQPQWLSFVKQNTTESVQLFSRLHTAEGCVLEHALGMPIVDEGLVRRNVSFANLWAAECNAKNLSPVAYDVFGVRKNNNPTAPSISNSPYAQRYVLQEPASRSICYLFQNSLGGFDTIRASGLSTYLPDGESHSFINNKTEVELGDGYTSIWQQNTGFIENERHARQWIEFFNSNNRYVLDKGTWKMIIVNELEVKHKKTLVNSYTFKYRLSRQDECAYYQRAELPEPKLPTKFYKA